MMPEELRKLVVKEQDERNRLAHQVHVCIGPGCLSLQSEQLKEQLTQELKQQHLEHTCQVKGVGCKGLCTSGPLVSVEPAGTLYQGVSSTDAPDIIASLSGAPLERLRCPVDIPFFQKQVRVVLENSGRVDPDSIEDYIFAGGYQGLLNVITELTPKEVIDQITLSGLRGRGGAGYPTGLKWTTVAKAGTAQKYVLCNADEGDPGAFMDRSVLEGDPHRVLEGMAIAAYAVGADQGYIYVRAEYPLAIKRLRNAIRRAENMGLLGKRIFETTFDFHIELRIGAGAFVCGEETALIASVEGKRGNPRPRPPYPAESGLWGCPTLINNVETFANVAPILRKGGDWFGSIGTEKSKGTKVFALTGQIKNSGLIEVPMGTTLRDIVFKIGGGIPNDMRFKAVQTGGPSGGCIPEQFLDIGVDYESLQEIGSIMGSGGMIVMDETSSMVDVARFFMEFCKDESCGKCVPCRVGTSQMYTILSTISEGMATTGDLAMLEELCEMVQRTSLCGLGQSAPNPVLSTLHYFRNEYLAHIRE
jgi:bidirectional [NiFe] hydrogenase diaphorase subunit